MAPSLQCDGLVLPAGVSKAFVLTRKLTVLLFSATRPTTLHRQPLSMCLAPLCSEDIESICCRERTNVFSVETGQMSAGETQARCLLLKQDRRLLLIKTHVYTAGTVLSQHGLIRRDMRGAS